MKSDTLTAKERLVDLKARLHEAERRASSEKAFAAANPELGNPWAGASEQLETLRHAIADAQLAEQGRALTLAVDRKRELDNEIERLSRERERADRLAAELAQDEAVIRFRKAPMECMRRGWAYSFELYRTWFLSGKPKHLGLVDAAAFFQNDAACPDSLRFTEAERAKVIAWNLAKGEAEKALVIWDAIVQQRALLLRERPELAGVA